MMEVQGSSSTPRLAALLASIRDAGLPSGDRKAAVRRAVEVCAGATVSDKTADCSYGHVQEFEVALDSIARHTGEDTRIGVSQAKSWLRAQGPSGRALAAELGGLSKRRNAQAHPSVGFTDRLQGFLDGAGRREIEGETLLQERVSFLELRVSALEEIKSGSTTPSTQSEPDALGAWLADEKLAPKSDSSAHVKAVLLQFEKRVISHYFAHWRRVPREPEGEPAHEDGDQGQDADDAPEPVNFAVVQVPEAGASLDRAPQQPAPEEQVPEPMPAPVPDLAQSHEPAPAKQQAQGAEKWADSEFEADITPPISTLYDALRDPDIATSITKHLELAQWASLALSCTQAPKVHLISPELPSTGTATRDDHGMPGKDSLDKDGEGFLGAKKRKGGGKNKKHKGKAPPEDMAIISRLTCSKKHLDHVRPRRHEKGYKNGTEGDGAHVRRGNPSQWHSRETLSYDTVAEFVDPFVLQLRARHERLEGREATIIDYAIQVVEALVEERDRPFTRKFLRRLQELASPILTITGEDDLTLQVQSLLRLHYESDTQ